MPPKSRNKLTFARLLGRCVAALRQEAEESQVQFAQSVRDATGYRFSSGALSQLETGRTGATALQLWVIEQALLEAGVLVGQGGCFRLLRVAGDALHAEGYRVLPRRLVGEAEQISIRRVDRIVGKVTQRFVDEEHDDQTRRWVRVVFSDTEEES